ISAAASQGKAEVHAQVGINVGPCPKNCQFCSFAPINKVFDTEKVYTLEEIIEKSLLFEADGANAIYLMATATYKFEDYIKIAKEVKLVLKPETIFIANTDDFDEDGAKALRNVGFAGIYHVIRMGEGSVTDIDPKVRLKTIAAAKKAGLLVGTCVEPVGSEHSIDELIEKTLLVREMQPVHAGSGRRINIPGSPLAVYDELNAAQIAHILAAVKLAIGYQTIGHCGGHNEIAAMAGVNLSWAEAGSNPRDTEANTVKGGTVKIRQETFIEAGWEILKGSSAIFSYR
ncbi:MAG TPA: radical SAM protein, partial [Negativicutes bacterium]